jgi:hypothetical protein
VGHPSVAVYGGGLDDWSRDPDLPMKTLEIPESLMTKETG